MTMQLTVWTYEGPPHVGAMRVATAMQGLHYVLHAPQGDTYADLLFTMIERRDRRPPVTYTTFSARDLGGDTAELFKTAARNAYDRFQPQAMIVGASCTRIADPGRSRRPCAGAGIADPGGQRRPAGLSAQGELGRRRDLLSAGARAGGTVGTAAGHQAAGARRREAAALQSARRRPRSASAIVTMSPRFRRCCRGWASTSMLRPRWARRPPTSQGWAMPISTWCCIPRSPD